MHQPLAHPADQVSRRNRICLAGTAGGQQIAGRGRCVVDALVGYECWRHDRTQAWPAPDIFSRVVDITFPAASTPRRPCEFGDAMTLPASGQSLDSAREQYAWRTAMARSETLGTPPDPLAAYVRRPLPSAAITARLESVCVVVEEDRPTAIGATVSASAWLFSDVVGHVARSKPCPRDWGARFAYEL